MLSRPCCAPGSHGRHRGRESMRSAKDLPAPVWALRMLSRPRSPKRPPLPPKAAKAWHPTAQTTLLPKDLPRPVLVLVTVLFLGPLLGYRSLRKIIRQLLDSLLAVIIVLPC